MAAIAEGRLDPAVPARRARECIAALDPHLRAFSHLAPDEGLGPAGLPLSGIPVSVKDVIDVAGMPTAGGTASRPPTTPRLEGVAVARLRAAGAVLVGKAETHELALGVTTPQCRNPWDPGRVPGGSSGGSAIGVVTGMVLGSLGTDTRASIRVPPALTGVVGFKPSWGLVPTDRWLTLSWTMDHFAPIARSVRDIALLLDVLTDSGTTYRSHLPGDLGGVALGLAPATVAGAEQGVLGCFYGALSHLEEAGSKVRHCATPSDEHLGLANAAGLLISRVEAAQYHRDRGADLSRCGTEVRAQLEAASAVSGTDYVRALRLRGQLRDVVDTVFEEVDLLVMPTCKVVAPLRTEADQHLLRLSENCIPWSLVDCPAITLFAGMAGGLPTGLQLVAPPGQDGALLAAAHAAEQALPPAPVWAPPPGGASA